MNFRNIFYSVLLIFLFSSLTVFGQTEPFECGLNLDISLEENQQYIMDLSQLGGQLITSEGTLKILVVFARFPDDNNYVADWPIGQAPNNMSTFIDENLSVNSTNYLNVTNFFDVMSLGQLNIIGNAIYVEAPHPATYYNYDPTPDPDGYPTTFADRDDATTDLIEQSVDPIINFSQYDNWTKIANYNFEEEPDGVVDMIYVIWRGNYNRITRWFGKWNGEASLGYGSSIPVDNGNLLVKTRFGNGSGLTVHYHTFTSAFHATNHEFGHWLLGGYHPYNSDQRFQLHGLLSGEGDCINSFERERLGWSNTIEVTSPLTVNLPDYLTTGIAYKYHPPNGATNEYYYFENHQQLNQYDKITVNPADKGIFIYHQKTIYNNQNNMRHVTANGYWDWENPFWVQNVFGNPELPAYRHDTVNPNGLAHTDMLPHTQNGYMWLYILADEFTNYSIDANYRNGKEFYSAYNTDFNSVFSKWSNPRPNSWAGSSNDFAMQVLNQNGSVLNVKFMVNNAVDACPAKIHDLRTSVFIDHPVLNWTANTEPDFDHYEVWRVTGPSPLPAPLNYTLLTTTTNNYYVDYSINLRQKTGIPHDAFYKVIAVDNTSKKSVSSNEVSVSYNVQFGGLEKKGNTSEEETLLPSTVRLMDNFPNPFNPTTKIVFELPDTKPVKLKIYNVTGQMVTTLVNGNLDAGSYQLEWKGTNATGTRVSSGIYLYELIAGDIRIVKKMFLAK